MIKRIDENVFDSGAECIVNTINCVGFMGKGLAFEFSLRYPELDRQYIEQCKQKQIHTGVLYFYDIDGQKIINFPTKFHFKYPSKMEWIEQGLQYFVDHYKEWDIKSVAFPLLGARNGGLDPEVVINTMEQYLSKVDIDVYICMNRVPDKTLAKYLEQYKQCSTSKLANDLKLNKKQTDILLRTKGSIKSFSEIARLDTIGAETYKKIYNYFKNGDFEDSQLTLF